MSRAHAILSASSCFRWLNCHASAKENAKGKDEASTYALEGTDAHALGEYLDKTAFGIKAKDPTKELSFYDQTMQEAAEGYRDFCVEQFEEAKKNCPDPWKGIEQRVDFSRWVPGGFGTADFLIVADDLLHIIDFKYGMGVAISAEENPQLMCYACGALDTFGDLFDIKRVKLSIYQPRRENISTWETTKDEVLKWADEVLAPAAEKALGKNPEYHAGDHCRFCRIQDTCRERARYNLELMQYQLEEPAELSNEEIALILPKIDSLVAWADDVKAYALGEALKGVKFKGMKLVEGRSTRKYTDEDAVAHIVESAGYDPFERKLLGITAMTKQLGKKKFEELLTPYITKPQGKPVLVSEDDRRPEYAAVTSTDFDQ